MRKEFQEIIQNPSAFVQQKASLEKKPTSVQQYFYQTVGNLQLLRQKQTVSGTAATMRQLLESYKGSYSNKMLTYKYMGYCMENKLADLYPLFNVLTLLSNWIEFDQDYKKVPALRFRPMIEMNLKYRGLDCFQDCIVYFHYIGLDLVGLLKRDQKAQFTKFPDHLNPTDLLWFTNVILPKVLFNVIIPLDFFPDNFLPFSGMNVDLLYRNQNVEMVARSKPHYQNFLKLALRLLCLAQLQQSQTKQLLLQSFKYYYLFHYQKNLTASQIVTSALKKISPAVRFALADQMLLFFTILKKLDKQLFLQYLKDKFDWAPQLIDKLNDQTMIGNTKEGLKPSPISQLPLVHCHQVKSGKKIQKYFEVYHKYSLLFFKMKACKEDITFRLYYLGGFTSPKERRQILMVNQKQAMQYQGSVEIIDSGIYMFEFDNSYSWIKAKNIIYQYTILTPMEIMEERPHPWLSQVLHQKVQPNRVPQDKVLKVIREEGSQLWRQRESLAIIQSNNKKFTVQIDYNEEAELYKLHMRRPDGTIYEYESEDRNLMVKKINSIKTSDESIIEWFVNKIQAESAADAIQTLEKYRFRYHQLEEEEQQDDKQLQQKEELQNSHNRKQTLSNHQMGKVRHMVRVAEECEKPEDRAEQESQELPTKEQPEQQQPKESVKPKKQISQQSPKIVTTIQQPRSAQQQRQILVQQQAKEQKPVNKQLNNTETASIQQTKMTEEDSKVEQTQQSQLKQNDQEQKQEKSQQKLQQEVKQEQQMLATQQKDIAENSTQIKQENQEKTQQKPEQTPKENQRSQTNEQPVKQTEELIEQTTRQGQHAETNADKNQLLKPKQLGQEQARQQQQEGHKQKYEKTVTEEQKGEQNKEEQTNQQ